MLVVYLCEQARLGQQHLFFRALVNEVGMFSCPIISRIRQQIENLLCDFSKSGQYDDA